MSDAPNPPTSVLETILYADNLDETSRFYADLLRLPRVSAIDQLVRVHRITATTVLLVFHPTHAAEPSRDIPSHGAHGPGHLAMQVRDLDAWRAWLSHNDTPLETEVTWPNGGRSLYFRDPANNSVELIDRDIWPPAAD